MTKKLIIDIETKMINSLDNAQYQKLHNVLTECLGCIEIFTEHEKIDEDDNMKLLGLFLSAKRVEGCSEKSLKYYKTTIEKLILSVSVEIRHIKTDDIRGYLANYYNEKGTSKVTIDNMRRIFSSFFNWLEDEDYILKSPVRRIHKVKTSQNVKDTYTDEMLELMRDNCKEIRDLALIDLLASTGMRIGELVRLNKEDIDFDERECIVLGKGDKERRVYFDARAKLHLREYINSRDDDDDALFVALKRPNERLKIGGIESRLKKLGVRLGIAKVYPHKFRRTMATLAIDKGMPVEQVQKLLGHQKIDTTMQYAMVSQNNVKISHRKYIG